MTEFEKYQYSIIDICQDLHGHFNGSSDSLNQHVVDDYMDWLEWRISPAVWTSTGPYSIPGYDFAVWEMAKAIIKHYGENNE